MSIVVGGRCFAFETEDGVFWCVAEIALVCWEVVLGVENYGVVELAVRVCLGDFVRVFLAWLCWVVVSAVCIGDLVGGVLDWFGRWCDARHRFRLRLAYQKLEIVVFV